HPHILRSCIGFDVNLSFSAPVETLADLRKQIIRSTRIAPEKKFVFTSNCDDDGILPVRSTHVSRRCDFGKVNWRSTRQIKQFLRHEQPQQNDHDTSKRRYVDGADQMISSVFWTFARRHADHRRLECT